MTGNIAIPKVFLRAMEPEDLDYLYRIENDADLWGVGVTNVPYSRYALHDFIANATGDIYTDKQVRLMVDDETHHTVGIVDLMNFAPRHHRAEVGIVIEKRCRGRHLAFAALRELHHYAYHVLHLHQLYAIVAESNTAARQLFIVNGYIHSGLLRHWLFNGEDYEDACLMQAMLLK